MLFPKFIRRAIRSGIDQSVLSDVTAIHTKIDTGEYVAGVLTDATAYTTKISEGSELPTATYLESSTLLKLDKYGRSVHASYEVIQHQKLDAFGAVLRSIGVHLSNALLVQAVTKMQANVDSSIDVSTEGAIAYADLTNLYGAFGDFDLTTLLVSPSVAAKIIALAEMQEMASTQPNVITLPFGAQLRKYAGMSSDYILGLNHRFGMEMVTSGDLLLETDKLIDNQLDVITMSIRVGFRVLTSDVIHVLNL